MTPSRTRRFCGGAALALCAAGFFACSRAEPGISYWTMRLVYYEDEESVTQRLSFFALVKDDDGPDDIEELRLYNDFEGLSWTLNTDNWVMLQDNHNTWIGSHTISMAGAETFPSGQWRAVIIDKSGERSERSFGFDVPKESKHPFPKFSAADGRWSVDSAYPEHFAQCYNAAGAYLLTVPLTGTSGVIANLGVPPETAALAYWGDDTDAQTAALTAPKPLH
ncbi:MAG: hypothetical protein LBC72_02510 [Spirochaetaceae bacterium]|jgi:hypothetical protein|nr:hypothetical protein [Spirochaetaceae bacterium]